MTPFVSNVSSLKGQTRRQRPAGAAPGWWKRSIFLGQTSETKETFLPASGKVSETAMCQADGVADLDISLAGVPTMSTASARSPASSRKRSFGGNILAILKVFVVRWRHYRASRALAGLSDYMLKDMGISRGEIHPLVSGSSEYRISRSNDAAEA
jgi:uncharacterized protein YjiS (DUF1127 family)